MGKRLTRAEIDSFHEHGFLPGLDVFGEEECDAFRSRVEAFEQARPEAVAWAFDIKTNLLFDWVYDLSRDPRLLDAVEDLIGPDVLLTNSIFRIKEPGSTTYYGWHQDAARIRVEPGFVLAFIAISDATPENGCLRVIPGSQREVRPFSLVSYADRQVARVCEVDERGAVDMVLARGQVGLLHCNTVHGSGPNRS
ncbi:MAG: phytanoyl-CoA dioxygenase family protein, partial [Gammaproteobacteria bacterium]|nr:phytanoyl-CoA dioxygenase family protein [Gammaproteobacteria bacterium]